MASTYTLNTGIEKPGTGEQSGTWGNTTNTNFDIIDRALSGVGAITLTGTSHTLTTTDGSLTDGMFKVLVLGGSPSGTNTITIGDNTQDKLYFVVNNSGQEVQFSQGTGANATIANGAADIIYADGAGSGAAVASFFGTSLKIGNDLTLKSDSAVLGFGADTDTTLTHTDGTGLTLNSTNKLTFGDAASFIQQSGDGILQIDGEATINMNASTALTVTTDTATFTSANANDPVVIIKNTTNDTAAARLHFVKDKGAAGADGDDIGTIEFISDDDGQTQTSFAKIVAEVSESANTDEAGKLSFFVAESDGTTTALTAGLILEGEHATDGEVDVTIGAGAASTTTISGILDINGKELILDADADTSITADTDDQIDIKVGNVDTVKIVPDVVTISGSHPDLVLTDTDDSNSGFIGYNNGQLSVGADFGATGATGVISFQIDGNEDVKIDGGGDLTIADGNLVIGTAGHGIDFSAAAAGQPGTGTDVAETSTATILDDYEEGTFTPVSNSVDNANATKMGMYVKVGNLVNISIRFSPSSDSTNGHQFGFHLPFEAATTESSGSFNDWVCPVHFSSAPNGNGLNRIGTLGGDGNYINVRQQGTTSSSEITGNSMGGTFGMNLSITYRTTS